MFHSAKAHSVKVHIDLQHCARLGCATQCSTFRSPNRVHPLVGLTACEWRHHARRALRGCTGGDGGQDDWCESSGASSGCSDHTCEGERVPSHLTSHPRELSHHHHHHLACSCLSLVCVVLQLLLVPCCCRVSTPTLLIQHSCSLQPTFARAIVLCDLVVLSARRDTMSVHHRAFLPCSVHAQRLEHLRLKSSFLVRAHIHIGALLSGVSCTRVELVTTRHFFTFSSPPSCSADRRKVARIEARSGCRTRRWGGMCDGPLTSVDHAPCMTSLTCSSFSTSLPDDVVSAMLHCVELTSSSRIDAQNNDGVFFIDTTGQQEQQKQQPHTPAPAPPPAAVVAAAAGKSNPSPKPPPPLPSTLVTVSPGTNKPTAAAAAKTDSATSGNKPEGRRDSRRRGGDRRGEQRKRERSPAGATKRDSSPPPNSRLFVGNLASERVTKEEMEELFGKYGHIIEVSMHPSFGFVQFSSPAAAKAAMEVCDTFSHCALFCVPLSLSLSLARSLNTLSMLLSLCLNGQRPR